MIKIIKLLRKEQKNKDSVFFIDGSESDHRSSVFVFGSREQRQNGDLMDDGFSYCICLYVGDE